MAARGDVVLSGSQDNTLRLWDLESGAWVGIFATTFPVCAIAVSQDLLTIGTDGGQVLFLEMHNLPPFAGMQEGYDWVDDRVEEYIRQRAYQLYEQRGRTDGFDLDDWFRAEAEVLGRSKLRQSL